MMPRFEPVELFELDGDAYNCETQQSVLYCSIKFGFYIRLEYIFVSKSSCKNSSCIILLFCSGNNFRFNITLQMEIVIFFTFELR